MGAPTPQVSVLLPVFNGDRFLAAAIESVLSQKFADLELVIIDDGSTDGTADVIDSYRGDARVRSFPLPKNVGLVASLNFGLKQCRGPLIARLDADDTCQPTRLERQVAAFSRDDKLVLHATAYDRVDPDGKLLRVGQPPLTHASLVGAMLSGNRLSHSTIMFRRSAVRLAGGYRSEWFPVEDYDLWLRLCEAGRFEASASSEVTYLENPAGISGTTATIQSQRHTERAFAEISRLSGRPVTDASTARAITRSVAVGHRTQRRRLHSRGISVTGLSFATYVTTVALLSPRPLWKCRAIIMTTAPALTTSALVDRHRARRD